MGLPSEEIVLFMNIFFLFSGIGFLIFILVLLKRKMKKWKKTKTLRLKHYYSI